MSDPTSPSQTSQMSSRRRRAMIACTNCRKRKIKCVTAEEPLETLAHGARNGVLNVYMSQSMRTTLCPLDPPQRPPILSCLLEDILRQLGLFDVAVTDMESNSLPTSRGPSFESVYSASYYNQQQPGQQNHGIPCRHSTLTSPWLSRQQPSSKCIQAAVCARRRQPPEWTTELLQRGVTLNPNNSLPWHHTGLTHRCSSQQTGACAKGRVSAAPGEGTNRRIYVLSTVSCFCYFTVPAT
ncbi:hypothetical protein B0H10DRAFT_167251 [Mycena sp. CBHHK59/15]|nr:hypothetical protein B0H10DRAFT_167251 [Mycena sp. CBHHK59/15]